MSRQSPHIAWRTAGRVSDQMANADEVVRETGWVFNNETGDSAASLADFVATGDDEVPAYLEYLGLRTPDDDAKTLVEIGSGIGRMTCAFTREYGSVVACDLDAGFLERCYETVGRFGKVDRLRTVHVADGRTLDLADDSADIAFSYITLQHCRLDDARVWHTCTNVPPLTAHRVEDRGARVRPDGDCRRRRPRDRLGVQQ